MKNLRFALFAAFLFASTQFLFAEINVIPHPNFVLETSGKSVPFNALYCIVCDDVEVAKMMSRTIGFWSGILLDAGKEPARNALVISVKIDTAAVAQAEGYSLEIDADGAVRIVAYDVAGAFYAAQTLVQLLKNNGTGEWLLPALKITDAPRFSYRGIMLDEGQRFLGKAAVKRLLDAMALFKFNTLHWRLSSDQGFRVESKIFPKLTEIGAWQAEAPSVGDHNQGNGKRTGGFYTQNELREIVAYAGARKIRVIPELEIFGNSAILAAYPELGNTDVQGYAPKVSTRLGLANDTFSPDEKTFDFLEKIFGEIGAIFPGEYFHVGGHFVPLNQWQHSAKAQQIMRREKLPGAAELRNWFAGRVEKMLESHGRKMLAWDGIQNGTPPKNTTLTISDDWKWVKQILGFGNNIVVAPESHCSLDFTQGAAPDDPWFETIVGSLTLEKIYQFEPVPFGISPAQEKQVLGCEALAWSGFFFDADKAEYMIFPRALAFAEVAWSAKNVRDWGDFSRRLPNGTARLERLKINYRQPDGTSAKEIKK